MLPHACRRFELTSLQLESALSRLMREKGCSFPSQKEENKASKTIIQNMTFVALDFEQV
jgi:hypothetical protein